MTSILKYPVKKVAVWGGNALVSINLLSSTPGPVSNRMGDRSRVYHLGTIQPKPSRPTQPGHPFVGRRNEYWWWSRLPLGKKRRVLRKWSRSMCSCNIRNLQKTLKCLINFTLSTAKVVNRPQASRPSLVLYFWTQGFSSNSAIFIFSSWRSFYTNPVSRKNLQLSEKLWFLFGVRDACYVSFPLYMATFIIIIIIMFLSLIHIWRCRRSTLCRSRWSPYH